MLYRSNFTSAISYLFPRKLIEHDNILAVTNTDYVGKGSHWTLIDLNFNSKEIRVLNSSTKHQAKEDVMKGLIKNLLIVIHVSNESPLHLLDYKLVYISDTPQQTNVNDCGLCAIKNAECIINQKELANPTIDEELSEKTRKKLRASLERFQFPDERKKKMRKMKKKNY